MPVNWRDRLAIWHAPRDNAHPWAAAIALLSNMVRQARCYHLETGDTQKTATLVESLILA